MAHPRQRDSLWFLIPAAVLWAGLAVFSNGLISHLESRDLFLFTADSLVQKLSLPGGLLAYTASFLTQFLHLPCLGALLLALTYTAASCYSSKVFGIPESHRALQLFPMALLTAALVHLGYMAFKLKYTGIAFAPALGVIGATLATDVTRRLNGNGKRHLWLALWTLAAYPLLGFFALIGTLSSGVYLTVNESRRTRTGTISLTVTAVAATPFIWYLILGTFRPLNGWLAMFPEFPKGSGILYYIPYVLLALWYVIAPVIAHLLKKGNNKERTPITLAAIALFLFFFWCKDQCLNAELRMERAFEQARWNKITRIYHNTSRWRWIEPTRLMVMYKDLALIKQGLEGDQAFTLRDGSREQKSAVRIPLTIQAGRQFYLHYGLPNYCYRWCFETHAETGWSYSSLRYAARASLLSGNLDTACKFLSILGNTLFYRKWADRQLSLTENPELIAQSNEYKDILPLLCQDNWLDNDLSMLEEFLSDYFINRTPEDASPEYWRVALFLAARKGNPDLFIEFYQQYLSTNHPEHIPTHYQEAIILFAGMSHNTNINRFPFDDDVRASYAAYRKYLERNRDMREPDDEFRQYFGRTYYYYWQTLQYKE